MTRLLTFVSLLLLATASQAAEPASLQSHIPGDRVLGKANAKVTLIEYASLSCPHCAAFHNTVLPAIKREYIDTGKVRLIFRDFPLNEPALHAAKLAHCAGEQGGDVAYFTMLQTLFETQQSWAFDQQFAGKLTQIAAAQKLDASKPEKCRSDKSLEE
jgi:protein-disulfide isomerase